MRDWLDPTGRLIAAIGGRDFAPSLLAAVRSIAAFDHMVIFRYHEAARPVDLFDNFPAGKRRIFVEDYQEGPYLIDPFYLAAAARIAPGLYRMRDLAPDRFYQSEYFRSYYIQTGLAEEIGYFIDLPAMATLVISLMRAEKPFSAREVKELRTYAPVVGAACRQNWHELSPTATRGAEPPPGAKGHQGMEPAISRIGGGVLTPRERDVVEYTIKGHSAEAVGRILGISAGTVRIHRRNIYAKLRIHSQGELFSEFIRLLTDEPA